MTTVRKIVFGLLVGILFWHASRYMPFISDDALISLRYAERLCAGDGLTWTDGERVEGYSDLLWVLLNAPATCLGADPIWSARVLGFIGALFGGLAISLGLPGPPQLNLTRLLSGGLLFVLTAPIAIWSIGGLEQGFIPGPLALGLYALRRGTDEEDRAQAVRWTWRAGACFGVLALLRADGLGLMLAATAGRYASRAGYRHGWMGLVRWLAIPIGAWTAQLVFRVLYYGEWVPNTALVKVAFNMHRVDQGLAHVLTGYGAAGVLVGLALLGVGLTASRKRRPGMLIALAVATAWPAYVVVIGGDIFPGWRQLVPGLVPLAILVADGAEVAVAWVGRWQARRLGGLIALASLMAAASIGHFQVQLHDSENVRGKQERWEWAGLPLGIALKNAFSVQQPLLAVDAAGALPFWSGLPALDMLGLNDHYLPRHPPKTFGLGGIGHELGEGKYVFERQPDLIAFCGASGRRRPCFLSGKQMVVRADFAGTYHLMRIFTEPRVPVGEVFVRIGSLIGFVRQGERGERLRIPGYLFSEGMVTARPAADGQLRAYIEPGASAEYLRLELPAGKYRLGAVFQPAGPPSQTHVLCRGVSAEHLGGDLNVLELETTSLVDLLVQNMGAGVAWLDGFKIDPVASDTPPGQRCSARSHRKPVRRPLSAFKQSVPESSYWGAGNAVRMGRSGLDVDLSGQALGRRLEMTADGNDSYRVDFVAADEVVASVVANPKGSGMRMRVLEVPAEAIESVADQINIRPLRGDASFSVVRLVFK